MPRTVRVKYYVSPDAASLAQRAAQYFVEMVGEAVAGAGTRPHRHQRRVHSQGHISTAGRPESAVALADAVGTTWISTGSTSGASDPTMRKATTA
jgi:hypothetical protein